MRKAIAPISMLLLSVPVSAQDFLTLDACRSMALEHNKALQMTAISGEKATLERKAAKTNYLPKVELIGTYQYTSEPISLLSKDQKAEFSNLGTGVMTALQEKVAASGMSQNLQQIAGQIIQANPSLAPLIQQGMTSASQYSQVFAQTAGQSLNAVGQKIVDALDTDTRNLAVVSVMLTQPLYMGGKIRAYDKITHYAEEVAGEKLRLEEQSLILDVDKAYWQVVSLVNKKKLAEGYRDLLKHLEEDVQKMIREGVATKANELSVSVKLNEAEMTLVRIEDGLVLSRMLLAQLCGLPLEATPQLADENLDAITVQLQDLEGESDIALANRPELRQLGLATQMYEQKVNIERSAHLPTLALTGGYTTTYPSLTDGFQTKFRGMWNVGLLLKVPLWHWGQGQYKVKAAKADVKISSLRLEEVREKVQLQVKQSALAVNEANRKLELSIKNLEKAEENLRMARVGFTEGMIPTSDLLAAQTAWLSAESNKIDSQIDIRLTQAAYNKAVAK